MRSGCSLVILAGGRSRRRYVLSESGLDMVDAYVAPVEQLRSVAQEFLAMRKGGGSSRPPIGEQLIIATGRGAVGKTHITERQAKEPITER